MIRGKRVCEYACLICVSVGFFCRLKNASASNRTPAVTLPVIALEHCARLSDAVILAGKCPRKIIAPTKSPEDDYRQQLPSWRSVPRSKGNPRRTNGPVGQQGQRGASIQKKTRFDWTRVDFLPHDVKKPSELSRRIAIPRPRRKGDEPMSAPEVRVVDLFTADTLVVDISHAFFPTYAHGFPLKTRTGNATPLDRRVNYRRGRNGVFFLYGSIDCQVVSRTGHERNRHDDDQYRLRRTLNVPFRSTLVVSLRPASIEIVRFVGGGHRRVVTKTRELARLLECACSPTGIPMFKTY